MKKLLEAIQQNLQDALLEKVELLSDIDMEGNTDFNLPVKSVNKNVESEYMLARQNMKARLMAYLFDNKEDIAKEINNPKNFKKYKGLIPANNKEQLIELLENGIELFGYDGNFNWIDTSNITDMSELFADVDLDFNGHIELWDVSNVTDMYYMFAGDEVYTSQFNQPIGDWDVSNVTNMVAMFEHSAFNQDISNWNVSNVNKMAGMFANAYKFNQPIGNWDVSNVDDMTGMFYEAAVFNQPIGNWDVSNVDEMGDMFYRANLFNQDISNWHIKNNTDTAGMFEYCPIKEEYKPNIL